MYGNFTGKVGTIHVIIRWSSADARKDQPCVLEVINSRINQNFDENKALDHLLSGLVLEKLYNYERKRKRETV